MMGHDVTRSWEASQRVVVCHHSSRMTQSPDVHARAVVETTRIGEGAVIERATGHLAATLADVEGSFVIAGGCSPR